ncbi:hypothetical protein ACFQ9Z_38025 [Streptomyces sp. NPDC056580]|uniref:hypothetical protein n=1 Tax=Streptomyces sp. NPDC056580 TaxID=3345872 RepID=UPI00369385C7
MADDVNYDAAPGPDRRAYLLHPLPERGVVEVRQMAWGRRDERRQMPGDPLAQLPGERQVVPGAALGGIFFVVLGVGSPGWGGGEPESGRDSSPT